MGRCAQLAKEIAAGNVSAAGSTFLPRSKEPGPADSYKKNLDIRRRLFKKDAEQPLLIESPHIGTQRLSLANH